MTRVRVAVVALVVAWFAPVLARAEAKPGFYAVSSCHIFGYGATKRAALQDFQRAAREARRGLGRLAARCTSPRHIDMVQIAAGQRPVFFVAGSRLTKGTDRREVIRRCRAEEEAERKAEPNVMGPDPAGCERVRAAYGPFARKPPWDELDDPGRYVFLDDEGNWVDDTGDMICFPAGTPVATPDGERPIETLAAGDLVLSWSDERGAPVEARVRAVKRRRAHELLEITLTDGRLLRVSANHPLFVPGRRDWVPAGELRAGDRLGVLTDGRLAPVAIANIATQTADVDVFDLTIEATHAYFAGGVLAHNY